jgi:aspartate racemase
MIKTEFKNNERKAAIGVLGGVGPLASAEFLKTIYEHSINEREQDSPTILMYSDPSFPDRTEMLLSGQYKKLLTQLEQALDRLFEMNVSRIVICCVTLHYLLPQLSSHLRERIISLIDVAMASVMEVRRKQLLICTNGTRRLEIFQSHRSWQQAKQYIVLPEKEDQDTIHDLIYQIKVNADVRTFVPVLESLLARYELTSFIAGCTELHLIAKQMAVSNGDKRYSCVDPLSLFADQLKRGMV